MSDPADTSPVAGAPVVRARGLTRRYRLGRRSLFAGPDWRTALSDVSLTIARGQSFGVVGESGSGKSTLARLVMALDRPDAGRVEILGRALDRLAPGELRALRPRFQIVFQDPYGSLDPRHRVARIVGEPLDGLRPALSPADRRARVAEAVAAVGLRPSDLDKYPHEFSGGQRQRIAVARAVATRPDLIVADEPVSALDVSVQAQILNMFKDLQDRYGLAYLFISHDLSVVAFMCDRVAVMYGGRIVEEAPADALFAGPRHPYTRLLLNAVLDTGQGTAPAWPDARRPTPAELALPLRELAPDHHAAI